MLKGVGSQNPEPSKKGDGYLSIENSAQVVYRTLTGRVLFSGMIAKKSAKIKRCEPAGKHKLKFTALVASKAEGEKFAIEHLEARFLKAGDMENFEKVYD